MSSLHIFCEYVYLVFNTLNFGFYDHIYGQNLKRVQRWDFIKEKKCDFNTCFVFLVTFFFLVESVFSFFFPWILPFSFFFLRSFFYKFPPQILGLLFEHQTINPLPPTITFFIYECNTFRPFYNESKRSRFTFFLHPFSPLIPVSCGLLS